MLNRVFELREETIQFLAKKNSDLVKAFKKQEAILRLAYLVIIFSHLNELNITKANDKISPFIEKLKILERRVKNWNFANFVCFNRCGK